MEARLLGEEVVGELPPAELGAEGLDRLRGGRALLGGVGEGVPEPADADLAEVQVRRQGRGAGLPRVVAGLAVGGGARGEEGLEPALGAVGAGLPERLELDRKSVV